MKRLTGEMPGFRQPGQRASGQTVDAPQVAVQPAVRRQQHRHLSGDFRQGLEVGCDEGDGLRIGHGRLFACSPRT